jgi:hypothetical protein
MAKITRRVRYRGTEMTGYVTRRVIHNSEALYKVLWDCDQDEDPRPYNPEQLESLPREDRQNLQIIKRANCMDRKWWEEQIELRGTVESREQWRPGDGWQRI